jgi:hypothetical protein
MGNGPTDFFKMYWREILLVLILFYMQAGINDAKRDASDAADYARRGYYESSTASEYAQYASDYASEAADNSSYCIY